MRLLLILALFASTILTRNDGRGIDPNGGRTSVTPQHRCTIDPNGGDPNGSDACVAATLNGDRGAGLDPNG